MQLSKRPAVYALPSYSLTGDLLAFLRCGLQYRYTRLGQLPSTQPVQMWFGEFIHGVLEEAYRRYSDTQTKEKTGLPPWSKRRLDDIGGLIKRRLAAQGLFPWSEELEDFADERAQVVINELGPELFPVVHRAEVRLTGARLLPLDQIPGRYRFREADRYEMVGVIDVVTHVEINDPALQNNRLVKAILAALPPSPPSRFEIIIDYKGMRRPPVVVSSGGGPSLWDIYGWQLQTYAHLRSAQEDSLPVIGGVIVYVNELRPTRSDLALLRQEIRTQTTDITPEAGSTTETHLNKWREKDPFPALPLEFRLRRALRVIEVAPPTIQTALTKFDDVVARIEVCRGKELQYGRVLSTWEQNPTDESTCTACDARTFCPSYKKETVPQLPGVRTTP
jgi:PD-(D/E)XK nuclease superfamily